MTREDMAIWGRVHVRFAAKVKGKKARRRSFRLYDPK